MTKIVFCLSLCTLSSIIYAQEPADALRYSWNTPGGTARVQAIGGANGSLGGDISSTFINPAGLGLYKTGDFVFTPNIEFGKAKASYLGRDTVDKLPGKFLFGTSGVVFGTGGAGKSIKGGAVSLAFNRSGDFNSNIRYWGLNNKSSYSQKFLEEIRNNNDRDANSVAGNYPFGTSLGFNTYWIDTVAGGSSNNYNFQTRAPIATGLIQQNVIAAKGGINEFALGFGLNLREKILLGGSIGVPILSYERNGEFTEADATPNSNNKFEYAQVTDNLTTSGVGINLKLGVILKAADSWRLGLAFHSPTLYTLTDKYFTSITTNTESYMGVQTQNSEDVSGAPHEFKYELITPYKFIASASYVLHEVQDVRQQKGFVTADIEYINYKASSFQPDQTNATNDQSTKDYLNSLNNAIDKAYKGAFNFRVGGELKFTTFMVRAGAAYYTNPYQNIHGENGNKLNLSGGIGYRNAGFFIDLTYVQTLMKDVNFAYRLDSSPYFGANIKNNIGNAILTIGFKI
jgi:hypothetical protein